MTMANNESPREIRCPRGVGPFLGNQRAQCVRRAGHDEPHLAYADTQEWTVVRFVPITVEWYTNE